jgi:uncharacterized damage-inducible protein DinB
MNSNSTAPMGSPGPAAAAPRPRADDVPPSFDERTTLITMLEYVRDTVHAKCAGLGDADARRAPLPTSPLTTISGLVNHLHRVEDYWIDIVLLGGPDDGPWAGDDDPDAEMRMALDLPLAQLLAAYRLTCDRHRELVAGLDLGTLSAGELTWRSEPVALRWILFHLIEETARHNGHIDLLREMADGVKGS